MYGDCEKVQDWSGDLTSNESGVLPSERVVVGERVKERRRERLHLCWLNSAVTV